jgi:hypothetical protein
MKKINSLYIRYSKSSKADNYFKILDSLSLKIIKSFKIEALLLEDIKKDMKQSIKFIEDYLKLDIKYICFKASKSHFKASCKVTHIVNSMKSFYVTEAKFCKYIHKLIDIKEAIKKQKEDKLLEAIIENKISIDKLAIDNKINQKRYRFKKYLLENNLSLDLLSLHSSLKAFKKYQKDFKLSLKTL